MKDVCSKKSDWRNQMALEFLSVSRQEFRIDLIFIIFQLHIVIENSLVEQTATEFYNDSSWKSDQNYAQNRKKQQLDRAVFI